MKVPMAVLLIASIIVVSLIMLAQSTGAHSEPRASRPIKKQVYKDANNLSWALVRYASQEQARATNQGMRSLDLTGVDQATVAVVETQLRELEVECNAERGPHFTKPPAVHFFASVIHSEATSGCGPNVEIELDPINGQISVEPELERNNIRELLIDSKLFDPSAQTYFITHGFMGSWNGSAWMCTIKDTILNSNAANVFIVDWSGGSKPVKRLDYITPVGNTKYVGALLGEFIRSLIELTGQPDASQYHMIGHSLGAHISGFAGHYLNGTLGRITGLDPAGPCFKAKSSSVKTAVEDGFLDRSSGRRRLSRQSANLVLALHTHGMLYGLMENCAHYDVYVNGGYKQPVCEAPLSASNPQIQSSLPIGCSHAYATRLLNEFVNTDRLAVGSATRPAVYANQETRPDRCHSIAYECANWNAFKAGECGSCNDADSRCIYTGLSSSQYQSSRVAPDLGYAQDSTSESNRHHDGDDDGLFNGEDGDYDKPEYRHGKHFMRAGPVPVTCMFHYQIIIAARKRHTSEPKGSDRHRYYLLIPLELSGRLTDEQGNRLNDRLVQVSHKLEPNSTAYNHLKTAYMDALAKQGSRDELEFYTALITFEPIGDADKCRHDQTNGATRKDKWQLCNTLDNIQETRLWSSSDAKLDAVTWVGMNYMSGFDYEQRIELSYLFS